MAVKRTGTNNLAKEIYLTRLSTGVRSGSITRQITFEHQGSLRSPERRRIRALQTGERETDTDYQMVPEDTYTARRA